MLIASVLFPLILVVLAVYLWAAFESIRGVVSLFILLTGLLLVAFAYLAGGLGKSPAGLWDTFVPLFIYICIGAILLVVDIHSQPKRKARRFALARDYQNAVMWYDEVLRLKPRDANAWHEKAGTLLGLGRTEDAVKCYEEALRIKPSNTEWWNEEGDSLSVLARSEEAARAYAASLDLAPDDARVWYKKGEAEQAAGDMKAAAESFRKCAAVVSATGSEGESFSTLAKCKLAELEKTSVA